MTQVTNYLLYSFWINSLILEARSQCLILINLNKNRVTVCDLFSHVQHLINLNKNKATVFDNEYLYALLLLIWKL